LAQKLRGVEAGRGIAATLVVLVHATSLRFGPFPGRLAFGGLFEFAHAGVDFFFVLSGFIIYHVHRDDLDNPQRLGSYTWRRFARIFPVYWIILFGFGLLLLYSPPRDPHVLSTGNIISSIFLLPWDQRPILPNAWTLRHELLFYTLFAVLILNRRIGRIILAAWAALIIWNFSYTWIQGHPFFTGLEGYLPFRIFNIEFFFGMAVALLVRHVRPWYPRTLLVIGLIIFFGDGLIESFGPTVPVEWPPRHLGYAFGAALALYGLVTAEEAGTLRVPSFLVMLGTASYSIYLTQSTTIMIVDYALRPFQTSALLQPELTFIAIVVIGLLPGLIFSRIIELPLLKILRRTPQRILGLRPSLR